jgi:RHS repeat-associated protein
LTITYNHLNLPVEVTKAGGGSIAWLYDANGNKLRKTSQPDALSLSGTIPTGVYQADQITSDGTVPTGATVLFRAGTEIELQAGFETQTNSDFEATIAITGSGVQDYVGGIEYRDGDLEAIYHECGRLFFGGSSTPRYEYTITDHLGNSRVTFADLNGDGQVDASEVLQEHQYYPFGMQMEGDWLQHSDGRNQYQYNGKELNEDLGLNWLDYGARWYDPSIGRWNAVDPLADQYTAFTPYGYVANNPIRLIDPDGMRIEYSDDLSKEDKNALKKEIRYLRKNSKTFKQVWKDLKKSEHTHTIHGTTPDDFHVDAKNGEILPEGNSSDIYLNPTENSIGAPQEAAVAHEIGHAWRIDQGLEPEYQPGDASPEGFVYTLKLKQYREFEATHFENVVRSELGLGLREAYGQVYDQNTNNTFPSGIMKGMLDISKQRRITIGRDRSYDYNAPINHYQGLRKRTRGRGSFNLKKYTDVNEYN